MYINTQGQIYTFAIDSWNDLSDFLQGKMMKKKLKSSWDYISSLYLKEEALADRSVLYAQAALFTSLSWAEITLRKYSLTGNLSEWLYWVCQYLKWRIVSIAITPFKSYFVSVGDCVFPWRNCLTRTYTASVKTPHLFPWAARMANAVSAISQT